MFWKCLIRANFCAEHFYPKLTQPFNFELNISTAGSLLRISQTLKFFSTASPRVAHCSKLHSEHFGENFIQKSKNILAVLLIDTLIQISTSSYFFGCFRSLDWTFSNLSSPCDYFSRFWREIAQKKVLYPVTVLPRAT